MTPPAKPDERLLADFLEGDLDMFAELVRRYERPLHAFICRLTGDTSAAPDLFQETFMRVFQKGSSFQGAARFRSWLYTIAANLCRSHGRKKRPEAALVEDNPNGSAGPNGAAADKEIGERIGRAVAALPHEQREVFVMRTYEDMTYNQIAEVLDRAVGTVKSQMRLALGKLRDDLRDIAQACGLE